MQPGKFGYLQEIPEVNNLRAMFFDLCQELATAKFKFNTYKTLFETKESVEVLNGTAPAAFGLIGSSFRTDIVVTLCRLTDPAANRSQQNLTFKTLAEAIGDPVITSAVEKLVSCCAPLRKHRNKSKAHKALEYALDPVNNRLPPIDLKLFNDCFSAAADAVNTISRKYSGSDFGFDMRAPGDGDSLLAFLTSALEMERKRRKELFKDSDW